ncbi:transcriptional regulator Hpr [uncultured Roseburia sp.]|uniref:MarR family transcriptional regulator n=1 Tax=Brotonthovivens ammoniilytica TaxID=2981725 RepID=A0ABT2TGX7_9FIRM|nr:MarR family transcriptional regulator [Brotonthovivens ammoniilytica]MCU6761435.1 MarR family transcriptional regulator [Brotonthovivens ammoniilytica]SCI28346.1 transcriptional regulator Hpr [uncultured Roseburia sp.]
MSEIKISFLQYMSIIWRNFGKYLDLCLKKYQIGSGQHFFLTSIYEKAGITMYDLARLGKFDKGTVTKSVQKLLELGYVNAVTDEKDKRVKHLYITEAAEPVIKEIYTIKSRWKQNLLSDFTEEEICQFTNQMERMAKMSCLTLKETAEEKERGEMICQKQ